MIGGGERSNEQQPIIIVRRRRQEDDGHHGGAWKIAFADFMTAMMALFLVLWLVNASDTEARKALASYFNPVKLVDRDRSRRGLSEPGEAGTPAAPAGKDSESADGAATEDAAGEDAAGKDAAGEAERAFRAAPEAVLAEREAGALAAAGDVDDGAVTVETSLASELRPDDPFAVEVAGPTAAESEKDDEAPSNPREDEAADSPSDDEAGEGEAEALQAHMRAAVAKALPGANALADAVTIEMRDGGAVVKLSDGPGFAMFDSGSFVPTGRTIVALKAMAGVLATRPGGIRIEGHTDSRPVRGEGDNWRLSTERAHSARLMLLRGGLDAGRIVAVSGFAASRPVAGAAPEADGNRRIEIVLERS